MKQLIEDYERRLNTVIKLITEEGNDLTINRLRTKASCYRTFLIELNQALTIPVVVDLFTKEQMEESFNDGIACQKQRAGYFDIDNYK